MTENVLLNVDGSVATVSVDRPEKRNAMDIETRRELRSAFEEAADDDSVRVIVLRGTGDGTYISGGDLNLFSKFDHMDGLEYVTKHAQGLYNFVADISKPTIAAIDGPALGGGMEISLACDIRIATTEAKLGLPEVKLGVFPAAGGTQRLPQIVGAGVAKELILTGRVVDADEAAELNLVNDVYEDEDEFEDSVYEMADQIASRAPVAVQMAKKSINNGLDTGQGLEFERVAGAFVFGTEDQNEGAKAFLEDREPDFQGR